MTYRFRVKNPKDLAAKARAVNLVWNYCGDVQNQARRWSKCWPSFFDLDKLTAGSFEELGLLTDTIHGVTRHFVWARDATKRRPRWRKSSGSKRSLGWVPFQSGRAVRIIGRTIRFRKVNYPLWMHRPIEGRIVCGSFAEDSRGRWYVNLQCEVAEASMPIGTETIGIDLGLKDLAALSTGEKIENPRHYRREEAALATAQRAGRRSRVRAIHAKIKNRRKHDLNVITLRLVRRACAIYVGNVSVAAFVKMKHAKSVLDAGWWTFRDMLRYKAMRHGVVFAEVDERNTTRACFRMRLHRRSERAGGSRSKRVDMSELRCCSRP